MKKIFAIVALVCAMSLSVMSCKKDQPVIETEVTEECCVDTTACEMACDTVAVEEIAMEADSATAE